MQLLILIFHAFVYILMSDAQIVCIIVPVSPTPYNGVIACNWGGVYGSAGCVCCGNSVACFAATQDCVNEPLIGWTCQTKYQYTPAGACAADGLLPCGTGCMPTDGTCCPSQKGWCGPGRICGPTENCVLDSPPPPPSSTPTVGPVTTSTSTTLLPASTSESPTKTATTTTLTSGSVASVSATGTANSNHSVASTIQVRGIKKT
ncbi:hypothetical protein V8E51_013850 [Hyaloscypha variabilis]